ncbi:MAG: PaaI family thioesterase, partial [Proteobacteria bacterium]|nr:PaaI family thioesterase [Pseudomonadota bacterium]
MSEPELIDPHVFGGEQRCFGCGPGNHLGMHLRFYRDGDEVFTRFVPQDHWEGPPGILHGGLQATVADEVAAWTLVGLLGRFGLTTSMKLHYLRPARMNREIEGRGKIISDLGKMAVVKVVLEQDNKCLLRGKLTFALPTLA